MAYTLGIDIGIASLGYAGVSLADKHIVFSGVHIFEAAERPKDGASLAAPRREKRGLRRVIHRRAVRKRAIRQLLTKYDLSTSSIDAPCPKTEKEGIPSNVWDWRKAGLERSLTDTEFAHVLFHIAKRRGFQSNRKSAAPNDLEGRKALSGAQELQVAMERANARTVGAYLATLPKKRNGDGSYERFVTRDLLRSEIKQLFVTQQKFGNPKATDALRDEYEAIAFYQRPLQSSEHLVGYCTLEPEEKRAPKFSYSAELFILWSKLNHTKIRDIGGTERFLTADERNRLAELAHKNKGGVSYKQVRKELELCDDERFNISYRKTKDKDTDWLSIRDTAESVTGGFVKLPGYHALKGTLDTGSITDWQRWMGQDRDKLDEIARILSFYEDEKDIDSMLSALGLQLEQISRLSAITNFSKTVDLSCKAINTILPHLQGGLTYDKACREAGYHHSQTHNKGLEKIPPFTDIRNPVVNRAMAQARKVINAIIRTHGMPEQIIVELSRDVGRSFKDRKNIEREQKKNQAYREEAKKHVAEILGIPIDNVTGEEILKYRLWKEQEGLCPYSGQYIEPQALRDPLATQIDHIIPYQRSWNDSYMNKVLCLTDENQSKGNLTPREYLDKDRWLALEAFAVRLPQKKAENLLMEHFDEEKAGTWKDRALNDTRYMARLLKNQLEQTLPVKVQTRNGALTANLRGAWGFPDKDRRNDRHHALDAIVLACSSQSMVQQLSNWNKYEARRRNPAEKPRPPKPWESFRKDAKASVENIFVSRMPVRKVTGAAHEDTIRSIRSTEEGERQIIQRIKLKSLTYATLENMVDKERNIRLYNLLKERLDQFDGKADKAFATPIYMPVNSPDKQAPEIHSIRIVTSKKSGVEVNGGLASNDDMVRVDVFQKKGKYFLVPVYVHHFAGKELPNKAIKIKAPEWEWIEMDSSYEFIFSLYKNDLVKIKKSNGQEIVGYYNGTDISSASIELIMHDKGNFLPDKKGEKTKNPWRGIGVKTLLGFEKYTVDYFGNISPEESPGIREQRLGLAHSNDSKSCETEPFERSVATGE